MRTIVIILFLLSVTMCSAQYKVTWKKVAIWGLNGVAGATWGMREVYHADPTVFERAWGVSKYSFWGSRAWERNYKTNRFLSPEGTPNPHKSEAFGNFGRDFWHTSGYVAGTIVFSTSFTIGASKQSLKYKLIDLGFSGVSFIGGSALTYRLLRKKQ